MTSGFILKSWEPLITFKQISGTINVSLSRNKLHIITIIVLSIVYPLCLAWLRQKDIPMKWLRLLKITKKSSMINTWLDTFHTEKRMIQIYLEDERIIRGWPHRYSSDPKDGFIYVANPVWINTDNDNHDYIETNAHGFLIPISKIDFIEFSKTKKETEANISKGDWNDKGTK